MSDPTVTSHDPTPLVPSEAVRRSRQAWSALEVLHVVGYFAPEPRQHYQALGLRPSLAYFAARSAAMGPVPPEVTTAVFYVFSPDLVAAALPAAWATAAPASVLQARHAGVAATLHRLLDDVADLAEVEEAADLAMTAATGLSLAGRPLFAAHSALPVPTDPLMRLWHAATLLREHRGDGHVAALVHAGLDPLEALVSGGAVTGWTPFLRTTRGWTPLQWQDAEARLVERGLLAPPSAGDGDEPAQHVLTDAGLQLRAAVEAQTDLAALEGWTRLGEPGTTRLVQLLRPWRDVVLAAGVLPPELLRRP